MQYLPHCKHFLNMKQLKSKTMHSLLSHCPKAAKYIRQSSGCIHDDMIFVKSRFMKV